MAKKRRAASRTGGQRGQNEEIPQKKDGAGRKRTAKKTQGVGHVVAEEPVETTDFSSVSANVIVCEGKLAYIKCSYPSKIKVSSATYGRTTDKSIFPHPAIHTTDCRSSTSDSKVKAMCNGKRICRVKAGNGQFGDPCSGTHKYLEVKYKCV
ncbi:L-rhamnose-binding lectin ELEL-1-like [Mytilus edulis]|uniref:L-rhamnose-binding lectin ELEL-1-like n=1 Tax=Mytilus edulis TaxID=6550 RepID=UPI0039EF639A